VFRTDDTGGRTCGLELNPGGDVDGTESVGEFNNPRMLSKSVEERGYLGESWYGNASVRTRDSTRAFFASLSSMLSVGKSGEYSGDKASMILNALSATAISRDCSSLATAFRIFSRKRFAPGWFGSLMSWKQINSAAENKWNALQFDCPGTACIQKNINQDPARI
jgi:hypothetical protein